MTEQFEPTFGELLDELVRERGLRSLSDLAAEAGLNKAALHIYRDRAARPRLPRLAEIINGLQLDEEWTRRLCRAAGVSPILLAKHLSPSLSEPLPEDSHTRAQLLTRLAKIRGSLRRLEREVSAIEDLLRR